MKISRYNGEGYSDPTAYQALKNILIRKAGVKRDNSCCKLKKRKGLEK
jgi:hypothetical protein